MKISESEFKKLVRQEVKSVLREIKKQNLQENIGRFVKEVVDAIEDKGVVVQDVDERAVVGDGAAIVLGEDHHYNVVPGDDEVEVTDGRAPYDVVIIDPRDARKSARRIIKHYKDSGPPTHPDLR